MKNIKKLIILATSLGVLGLSSCSIEDYISTSIENPIITITEKENTSAEEETTSVEEENTSAEEETTSAEEENTSPEEEETSDSVHDPKHSITVEEDSSITGLYYKNCTDCDYSEVIYDYVGYDLEYIEINNLEDFLAIPKDASGNYKLMCDIDLAEVDFNPITLTGVFNGNLHTIKNTSGYLFDYNKGVIENLHVVNMNCITSTAGICSWNYGTIVLCAFEGDITYTSSGYTTVGGICSTNVGIVSDCYFRGNAFAYATSTRGYPASCGGIVGKNSDDSCKDTAVVKNCYAIGTIYAEGNGCDGNAGGIVGDNYYYYKEVSNCYFSGSVEGIMLMEKSNYRADAGAIVGGYFGGKNSGYFDSIVKVTNGGYGYSGIEYESISDCVENVLKGSVLYLLERDADGNPILSSVIKIFEYTACDVITIKENQDYSISLDFSVDSSCTYYIQSDDTSIVSTYTTGGHTGVGVTGRKVGETYVTITSSDGNSKTIKVVVVESIHPETLEIPETYTIKVGETWYVPIQYSPKDATIGEYNISVSDYALASTATYGVHTSCSVTGLAAGTVVVTITTTTGLSASCTLTIEEE